METFAILSKTRGYYKSGFTWGKTPKYFSKAAVRAILLRWPTLARSVTIEVYVATKKLTMTGLDWKRANIKK